MIATVLHLNKCARVTFEMVDRMRPHRLYRHDVGHGNFLGRRPGAGIEFFFVADDTVDLRHGGKCLCFGLRGTTRDSDVRAGLLAPDPADHLPGLPHRFAGHRAGVHHDHVVMTGCGRL